MAQKRRKRAAAGKQARIEPLVEMSKVEKRFEAQAAREAGTARHALDRMHFWGGVSLLVLSVVLSLSGIADMVYLSTAFAGTLAMLIE